MCFFKGLYLKKFSWTLNWMIVHLKTDAGTINAFIGMVRFYEMGLRRDQIFFCSIYLFNPVPYGTEFGSITFILMTYIASLTGRDFF